MPTRNLFEGPGTTRPPSRTFLPQIGRRAPSPPRPQVYMGSGRGAASPASLAPPAPPVAGLPPTPVMGSTYPWLGAQQAFQYPTYLPLTSPQAPSQYSSYLPTIMRPPPAWANANPFLRDLYTPAVGGASVGAQAQVGDALVDRSGAQPLSQRVGTLTSEGATTPGGKVEPEYATAPDGVDAGWYRQFQIEHEGEKPEDFYARTGEGLDEAVADRDWGNRFAQMMGRAPSEYDWEEHWYATRPPYRGRPMGDPGPGWRRKSKRGATDDEKRPPLYVPQQTSWRV